MQGHESCIAAFMIFAQCRGCNFLVGMVYWSDGGAILWTLKPKVRADKRAMACASEGSLQWCSFELEPFDIK